MVFCRNANNILLLSYRAHPTTYQTFFASCFYLPFSYTSIGSMEDTHPNPSLRYVTDSGLTEYRPAYALSDFHLERSGRRRPNPVPCEVVPKPNVNWLDSLVLPLCDQIHPWNSLTQTVFFWLCTVDYNYLRLVILIPYIFPRHNVCHLQIVRNRY